MSASHHTRIEHEPAHRLGRMIGAARAALVCLAEGNRSAAKDVLFAELEREAGIQNEINAELDEYDRKRREEKP